MRTHFRHRSTCMVYCRVVALFVTQLIPLSAYAARNDTNRNSPSRDGISKRTTASDVDTSLTHYLRYGDCVIEVNESHAVMLGLTDGVVLVRFDAVDLQTRFDRELAIQARRAVGHDKVLDVVRKVHQNPINHPQFNKTISEQQIIRRVEGHFDAGRQISAGVLQQGPRVEPADIDQRIVDKMDLLKQRERYLAEMHDHLESIGHIA
jgi:hypothetical protein